MNNEIVMINVEEIKAHPDNPRKDLGDLTELAESIRKNGVLQNLTVIPAKSGGYMTVIGHRRCAAAKMAGLNTVPCIISDMDHKTQVHTMLTENMQRSDLTPLEQAQGFQMMLDLGSSVAEIVQETGFSESTVRHRLKLTELDQSLLKEKCAENINMFDLIKLEQIKDSELKNEVLKTIGTSDFNWKYKGALQKEKNKARWEEVKQLIGDKVEMVEKTTGFAYKGMVNTNETDEEIIKEIEKIKETADELFCHYVEPHIFLYAEYKASASAIAKADPHEEERKAKREQNINMLKEKHNRMKTMWWDFLKKVSLSTIKENLTFLLESAARYICLEEVWGSPDQDDMLEAVGIDTEWFDELEDEQQQEVLTKAAKENTNRLLLLGTFSYIEDGFGKIPFDWQGKYKPEHKLHKIYDFLSVFGYRTSEEEQQILDGSHENYND